MSDLAEWLLEQIAEDERQAGQHLSDGLWDSPHRVLAECEAKRRIIDLWQKADSLGKTLALTPGHDGDAREWRALVNVARDAVTALVLPYADRPGYREEWKP